MIFEGFSRPKSRKLLVPSDDVQLHIPGRMTGVFDGASDSLGRKIGGTPIGRLAASAAANAAAGLSAEAFHWPAADILNHLSAAVGSHVKTVAGQGPASTTTMIAFEGADGVRLLGLGDTGYRINGGDACVAELGPDQISIPARVALFRFFQDRGQPLQTCEDLSRRCIGEGFTAAVSDDVLSPQAAERIVQGVLDMTPFAADEKEIRQLLNGGLQSQFRFANAPDAQLGYGVLNGQEPDLRHAIDVQIAYRDLATIEIFSDGYLRAPKDVTIAAWEKSHADIERRDPHKIDVALAVKGSTEIQFFDDRTVTILRFSEGDSR